MRQGGNRCHCTSATRQRLQHACSDGTVSPAHPPGGRIKAAKRIDGTKAFESFCAGT